MKTAILSDIHDNLANFRKAVGWIKKEGIETIIICGDIGRPETLKEGLGDFSGKVFLCMGNLDTEDKESFKISDNYSVFGDFGEAVLGNKKTAFSHFPEIAEDLAKSGKYDLVFYGHTHKPWEAKIGNCRLVNPGNITGTFYKPSFAVYDPGSDSLDLKILELI
jgi:hypothetical protein